MITTDRHTIRLLEESDSHFILELLNTEGWLRYIGNRNINSELDALSYISRINENPNAVYWVIVLKENQTAIGLVTLIQRDYLEFRDIGFALLPAYSNQGHTYEATKAVLAHLNESIAAITLSENKASIKLIERLGFKFDKIIERENEKLSLYRTQ